MPAVCAVLRTYATQARALGLRCVAAGVETQQQHAFLVGAGIELAQGYYYERPLPAASFEELIREPAGVVERGRQTSRGSQAFLVSAKISAISSILASSSSALAASNVPLVPAAPASLVASLTSVWSCGYFSKCGGLK